MLRHLCSRARERHDLTVVEARPIEHIAEMGGAERAYGEYNPMWRQEAGCPRVSSAYGFDNYTITLVSGLAAPLSLSIRLHYTVS